MTQKRLTTDPPGDRALLAAGATMDTGGKHCGPDCGCSPHLIAADRHTKRAPDFSMKSRGFCS